MEQCSDHCRENTIVNLCSNPTVGNGTITNKGKGNEAHNGSDDLGYFQGYILYCYDAEGWPIDDYNPEDEWDINKKTSDGRYAGIKAKQ